MAERKASTEAAEYQPMPKDGKRCGMCAMFQTPNQCTAVEGRISPQGHCKLYKRRGKAQQTIASGSY